MRILVLKKRHIYVAVIILLIVIVSLFAFLFRQKARPAHTYPIFKQALISQYVPYTLYLNM